MTKRYWLDLFSGVTWDEFLKNGAEVSGFSERRKAVASKIRPGDFLLCYMTGISRFIGVLEVKGPSNDNSKIWKDHDYPIRFKVKLVYQLQPETAVPMSELKNLSVLQNLKTPTYWTGFFRGSPNEFKNSSDGEAIVNAIEAAVQNPVKRPYDEKKYWRKPPIYELKKDIVTVPDEEEEQEEVKESTIHKEIQWLLLKLGSDLGLGIWVATNDRNRSFNGQIFKDIPRMLSELPIKFDVPTKKTIEHIDVLWLEKGAIVAAFEVEHSTAIYSGLLRMSDLISMQPNIKIDLYIVAPDEREEKVRFQVNRKTFANLSPPLVDMCKFIPYSELRKEVEQIGHRVKHMNYTFIKDIARSLELIDSV